MGQSISLVSALRSLGSGLQSEFQEKERGRRRKKEEGEERGRRRKEERRRKEGSSVQNTDYK